MRLQLATAIVMAAASVAAAGPATKPAITIGAPRVAGSLTAGAVGASLAKAKRALRACHHPRVGATRALPGGEVAAAFTVTAQGTVEHAAASGVDPDVATCVVDVLGALAFPAADATTTVAVAVRYRVALDRTLARVADLVRTQVSTDGPSIDLAGVIAARDRDGESWSVRGGGAPGSGLRGSDAMDLGTVTVTDFDPAPPLDVVIGIVAAHESALALCFAPGAPDATFTVEADPTGAVTGTTIDPATDAATTTCATAVIGALPLPSTDEPTRFAIGYARAGVPRITAQQTVHVRR